MYSCFYFFIACSPVLKCRFQRSHLFNKVPSPPIIKKCCNSYNTIIWFVPNFSHWIRNKWIIRTIISPWKNICIMVGPIKICLDFICITKLFNRCFIEFTLKSFLCIFYLYGLYRASMGRFIYINVFISLWLLLHLS